MIEVTTTPPSARMGWEHNGIASVIAPPLQNKNKNQGKPESIHEKTSHKPKLRDIL